jgi:hypothetical protein
VVITADDVTLAHITIQRAIDHPVHVYPPEGGPDVTGPRLYGVRLVDGGEQFLKVNPNGDASAFVDEGAVECSELVMTDEGRPHVETLDSGACYTGGIDVHAARGWVVRSSRFQGIYCTNGGLAEHAIHFWRGARDTVIENNVIVDCARGIGLGMGSGAAADVSTAPGPTPPTTERPLGHVDGVVANNVIWAAIDQFDTGIEIQQARRVTVLHNSVVEEPGIAVFFSSIDYRFAAPTSSSRTTTPAASPAATGRGDGRPHVETESLAAFVDAPGGDFHLLETATEAIDRGRRARAVRVDPRRAARERATRRRRGRALRTPRPPCRDRLREVCRDGAPKIRYGFHVARLPSWVAGAALPFALGACAGEGGEDPRSSVPTPLCISEILYHPVLEDSYEELHEFVEIHNPTAAAVSLAGYTLGAGTEAAFPAVELPPGGTVGVARDREALLGVTEYALEPSLVFGDASRSLDNGGDLVLLRPPRGAAEAVAYDDGPPWPVAADALGASEAWLPADWLPLESHRHRGVSLERVSCALPADDPASWVPSPIDGPTQAGPARGRPRPRRPSC